VNSNHGLSAIMNLMLLHACVKRVC